MSAKLSKIKEVSFCTSSILDLLVHIMYNTTYKKVEANQRHVGVSKNGGGVICQFATQKSYNYNTPELHTSHPFPTS